MIKKFILPILVGIATNVLCAQEPLDQPTNFVFSSIKPYGYNISFTGSGAEGYLILRGTSPFSGSPVDGTVYQKGGGVGNAKVFSSSGATFAQIKETHANTTYYFTVFAYNGSGTSRDYLQTNPLTASMTTPDNLIGNYYQSIDQNAATFITDLRDLLQSTYTFVDYDNYNLNIIPAVFQRDTAGGKKVVQCAYSNQVVEYTAPFSFTAIDFSREHCLPRSWMPTNPDYSDPEGADYHNLLLTNLGSVNSQRSNHPMGYVLNSTYSFLDCQLGTDSIGATVFEPADNIKGDVARSMLYQLVSWTGTGGYTWAFSNLSSSGPNQNINTLLDWHFSDPPDGLEKAKTEYIYFIQKNRNPFIDYPEWVNCINFYTLVRKASCFTTIGIDGEPEWDINIYPNPATDYLQIESHQLIPEATTVQIVDMKGSILFSQKINPQLINNPFTIDLSTVNCGVFLLKMISEDQLFMKKFIIQK